MSDSTASARPGKSAKVKKPHPDFPLTYHPSGRWCKKVKGKLHYFGRAVADAGESAQTALELWLDQKDNLLAGRVPRARQADSGPVLHELVNKFLTVKASLQDSGELSPHTWQMYKSVCGEVVATFGRDRLLSDITADDFGKLRERWAKKWGVERIAAEINRCRTLFNFAWKHDIIDRPIKFGAAFTRPSKKARRLNRAEQGIKMFEAAELRKMIEAASQPLKAMLLLAINAGLGNTDVALMTDKHISGTWLNYPRPKTGIMRRCPLWPETLQAIEEWRAQRPTPKTDAVAALLFLTVRGDGWATDIKDRPITHATRKLLDKLKIEGNRNFYAVRHSFETVAGDSRDQVAVNAVMGHDDGSMSNVYRERISDDRLRAVAEHVRRWLFSAPATTTEGGAK